MRINLYPNLCRNHTLHRHKKCLALVTHSKCIMSDKAVHEIHYIHPSAAVYRLLINMAAIQKALKIWICIYHGALRKSIEEILCTRAVHYGSSCRGA